MRVGKKSKTSEIFRNGEVFEERGGSKRKAGSDAVS